MKKNMGSADRVLRVLVALVVLVLWMQGIISGTSAIILLAVGAVFLLTSLLGTCPLYLPFGISTRSGKK